MPRVTEVLDYYYERELVDWMLKNVSAAKRKSEESKRVGTLVDRMVQDVIRTGTYTCPPHELEAASCMAGFEQFLIDHPSFLSSIVQIQEELIDGKLIGHPDIEVLEATRWGMVDIKSSAAIYPKYWIQDAQYTEMKRKLVARPLPRFIAILRLDKSTRSYEYVEVTDEAQIQYEVDTFKHFYGTYQHGEKVRDRVRQALEKEFCYAA